MIELEVGFTQEVFKKKQVLADQRFAEKIQTRDTSNSSIPNLARRMMPQPMRMDNMGDIEEFLRVA
jgi:hypothetical protein